MGYLMGYLVARHSLAEDYLRLQLTLRMGAAPDPIHSHQPFSINRPYQYHNLQRSDTHYRGVINARTTSASRGISITLSFLFVFESTLSSPRKRDFIRMKGPQ
jgi:hypothetical protein